MEETGIVTDEDIIELLEDIEHEQLRWINGIPENEANVTKESVVTEALDPAYFGFVLDRQRVEDCYERLYVDPDDGE